MYHYYLFYKPYQTLCQFSPEGDKRTLAHYLGGLPKNVYPVGRLDYDSEGLLLLTDDKALTNQLLHPGFAHPRTYYAQLEGMISNEALAQLRQGVEIKVDGLPYRTKKATAILLPEPQLPERIPPIRFRKNVPTSWIALTLMEGKNRQVRHMTAAVGFPTLRLVRFAIGAVTIGALQPGNVHVYDESIKPKLLGKIF